jgi:hypothetical protein
MLLVDAAATGRPLALKKFEEVQAQVRRICETNAALRAISLGVFGGPRKHRMIAPTLRELETTAARKLRPVLRQRDLMSRGQLLLTQHLQPDYRTLVKKGVATFNALEALKSATLAPRRENDVAAQAAQAAAIAKASAAARAAVADCATAVQLPPDVAEAEFVKMLQDKGAISARNMHQMRRGLARGDAERRLLSAAIYNKRLWQPSTGGVAGDQAPPLRPDAVPAHSERHFPTDLRRYTYFVGADFIKDSGPQGYLQFKGNKAAPKRLLEYMKTELNDKCDTGPKLFTFPEHFTSKHNTNHTKHTRSSILNYNSKLELTARGRALGVALPLLVRDDAGKRIGNPLEKPTDGGALVRIIQRDISAALLIAYEAERFGWGLPRSDALSFKSEIKERARYATILKQCNGNHKDALPRFVDAWHAESHCLSISSLAWALHGVWQPSV